jgi:hypothetical protein
VVAAWAGTQRAGRQRVGQLRIRRASCGQSVRCRAPAVGVVSRGPVTRRSQASYQPRGRNQRHRADAHVAAMCVLRAAEPAEPGRIAPGVERAVPGASPGRMRQNSTACAPGSGRRCRNGALAGSARAPGWIAAAGTCEGRRADESGPDRACSIGRRGCGRLPTVGDWNWGVHPMRRLAWRADRRRRR